MSRNLIEAWARFGTDVMQRVPELAADPRKLIEWTQAPQRYAMELHDAWLEGVGGVSRGRYLAVVEENLELRRRIDRLERERVSSRPPPSPVEAAAATTEALDGAFKQIREAQEQWLSLWLPSTDAVQKKS